MTASVDRRRRFTAVGAILGALGIVTLIVVSAIAVTTLRTSQEGKAPPVDQREVVVFPETPNGVIGVVDDFDRLTSIAVLTLDPSGTGGSVVVVPVNVDQSNGFGEMRLPVSRQPYAPGNDEQAAELISELEPLLTLTIQQAFVAGPDELGVLLEPLSPFDVELSESIVDSDTPGSGIVVPRGNRMLDTATMVAALTAIDATDSSYAHHGSDVELWSAIANGEPTDVEAPLDDTGRPLPPQSFDELWGRLFTGDVGVRDLDIDESAARSADNVDDADFVIADRPDALLVFGGISPALVTTPNESLTVSLVVRFDPDDVAELGTAADGTQITKTSMTRRFIGELLFAKANVVGVDMATDPDEVPDVTQLMIVSESMEIEARGLTERFFGDAEVVIADRLLDGVDVVAVLGADFLDQRAELLEIERAAAEQAEVDDAEADFDLTGGEAEDLRNTPIPAGTTDTVVEDG